MVVLDRAEQTAQDQVQAAGLVAREFLVLQVGLVDDLGEDRELPVAQAGASQQRLEVQSSPWWPRSTPAMSKGMASAGSWSGGAKANSASGSTKRLMSQAEAIRSIQSRSRVAQVRER